MEWLIDLIGPGHTELASTLVLYSFVIAAGIFLGKLKIGEYPSELPSFCLSESSWDISVISSTPRF